MLPVIISTNCNHRWSSCNYFITNGWHGYYSDFRSFLQKIKTKYDFYQLKSATLQASPSARIMSCISSQIYISQISWILMSDDRLKYKYSNCCLLANYIQQMVKDAIKSSPSLIYVLLSIRIFVQLSSKNFFSITNINHLRKQKRLFL